MLHVGAKGLAGLCEVEAVLSHEEGELVVHVAAPYGRILPGTHRLITPARAHSPGGASGGSARRSGAHTCCDSTCSRESG